MESIGDSASGKAADRAGRVAKAVGAELKRDKAAEALRLLEESLAQHWVPGGMELLDWLNRELGKQATMKLVSQCARRKCFYCRSGLETCDKCDGRGFLENGEACEGCGSLGVARCDFCDGTGLLTYNAIPLGLREPAAMVRVSQARLHIQALARKVAGSGRDQAARQSLESLSRTLVQVNAVAGVCENAIVLLRHSQGQESSPTGERISKAAAKCGAQAIQVMRKVLADLARTAARAAESTQASVHSRRRAAQRAEFFNRLLKSTDLAFCSSLHHPFLTAGGSGPACDR